MWGSLFRYLDFAWQDLLGDVTLGRPFPWPTGPTVQLGSSGQNHLAAGNRCDQSRTFGTDAAQERYMRGAAASAERFEWQMSLAPKIMFGEKLIKSETFFLERNFHRISKLSINPSSRNPVGILNAPTPFGIPSLYHRWVLSCLAKWFQYLCVCLKTRNLQALDGNVTGKNKNTPFYSPKFSGIEPTIWGFVWNQMRYSQDNGPLDNIKTPEDVRSATWSARRERAQKIACLVSAQRKQMHPVGHRGGPVGHGSWF